MSEKYYSKSQDGTEPRSVFLIEKHEGEKPITIDTVYGEIIVQPGYYIITDEEGNKIGSNTQDVALYYEKVE